MTPLGDLTAKTISNRRLAMLLMILFAALTLSLSAVGAYGVMSHAVQQRTAEIGIRMALGAEPANILRLIVTQGLSTAVSGTVIGLIAAHAMLAGTAPGSRSWTMFRRAARTVDCGRSLWIPMVRKVIGICENGA